MRMKCKEILLIIFCCCFATLPAFSSNWKIGNITDEFGDPTGEEFAYCVIEGSFSNSATANSPTFIRVCAQSADYPKYATVYFTFEIHDYSFDTPVNNYYSNTNASFSFKDAKGTISRYETTNSRFTKWNELNGNASYELYKTLMDSPETKCSVVVGTSKYNFTITNEGFDKAISQIIKNKQQQISYKWNYWYLKTEEDMFEEEMNEWVGTDLEFIMSDILGNYESSPTYEAESDFIIDNSDSNYILSFDISGKGREDDVPYHAYLVILKIQKDRYQIYDFPITQKIIGLSFHSDGETYIFPLKGSGLYSINFIPYNREDIYYDLVSFLSTHSNIAMCINLENGENISIAIDELRLKDFLVYPYSEQILSEFPPVK